MEVTRAQLRRTSILLYRIDEIYYHIAKTLGVTENMLVLLYALNDGKAHTQKEICQEWLLPKTTINTLVQECAAAGHIHLEPHAREKTVRLTTQGKAYAEELLAPVYAAEEAAIKAAGPVLSTALERFADGLQTEFDRYMLQGETYENQNSTV